MSKDDKDYTVGYAKTPEHTRFGAPNGNPINRKGRKKTTTTFEDEVKAVFSAKITVKVDGVSKQISKRQIIFEQVANGAVKGDSTMIRLAMPLMKTMDDAPEFEPLPEDKEVLKLFKQMFNDDGSEK